MPDTEPRKQRKKEEKRALSGISNRLGLGVGPTKVSKASSLKASFGLPEMPEFANIGMAARRERDDTGEPMRRFRRLGNQTAAQGSDPHARGWGL